MEIDKLKKKKFDVPFIAITESWIKQHISDAQLTIDEYNVFRADREKSKNGGALLYVHTAIIIDNHVLINLFPPLCMYLLLQK